MAAYDLEGVVLDFFTFEGIVRPPADGLPAEIRQVGIALQSAADIARIRHRVEEREIAHWVERHAQPPAESRPDAGATLEHWIESHSAH